MRGIGPDCDRQLRYGPAEHLHRLRWPDPRPMLPLAWYQLTLPTLIRRGV